jgi:hypothetical protein
VEGKNGMLQREVMCKKEVEKVGKGLTYGEFSCVKVNSKKSLGNDVSKQTRIGRNPRGRVLQRGKRQYKKPANLARKKFWK